jgi:hypothetical protein
MYIVLVYNYLQEAPTLEFGQLCNKMVDYLKDGKCLAFRSAIVRGKDGQIGL